MTGPDELIKGCENRTIGIVSTALPNTRSGQGNVLKQLLEAVRFGKYTYFSDSPNNAEFDLCTEMMGRFVSLGASENHCWFKRKYREYFNFGQYAALESEVLRRKNILVANILSDKIDILISCTASLTDIPAAFLAAQETNIPFFLYIFDDYVYQWRGPLQRKFAFKWECSLITYAKGVFCPNEMLAEDYAQRYGISPIIIRNPVNITPRVKKPKRELGTPFRIVYTGSIYDIQIDSFLRLLEASFGIKQDIELHIYSSQEADVAPQVSCQNNVLWHGFVSNQTAIKAQQEADLLFLPLSFSDNLRRVVRSAAPGKIGEFLSSGTPILVHAPEDSFVSKFFKENYAGYVVDKQDVTMLSNVLSEIISEESKISEVVENAYALSNQFSIRCSASIFLSHLIDGS